MESKQSEIDELKAKLEQLKKLVQFLLTSVVSSNIMTT